MSSPAAITLLVPCYNAARFLPRLAASVQQLTVGFADVLCYDDGSTDDTAAVATKLGWRILTPNENRGVAHARNQLVAAARTEWFHFHDADDLLAPAYLERLAPWCDSRHDVVGCDADWLDESSRALVLSWRYDPAELQRDPTPYLLAHPMSLNNTIIRRASWLAVDGCDESLAMWEDADVHFRLARHGARFFHVPEVLTHALRRGESFSHDYAKSWKCRLAALERYATHSTAAGLRPVLAAEAELTARQLAQLQDAAAARQAIDLCRRLGGDPPSSRSFLVRLLKPFVPALTLLRWQERLRRRPQA